jgi:hypothetical protein
VADRGNKRIQERPCRELQHAVDEHRSPLCHLDRPRRASVPVQHGSTSDPNPSTSIDTGEIHKMELGRPRPQPVPAGKLLNEFGTVEEIDSRNPDEVYVGEVDQLESRAQPALD